MAENTTPPGLQDQEPQFLRAGDCGLYVVFPQVVDPAVNRRVRRLARAVVEAGWPGVVDVIPSYAALYVRFDPVTVTFHQLVDRCRERLAVLDQLEPEVARVCLLPTAYGGEWGPDLEDVARFHGLDPGEVVRLHAGRDYFVYFLGFSPGFPFLGGLDPRLATPRRSVPRTRVPAGSVGIAGEQTGVYPVESPGGWNLIGRTPVRLFDPASDPPALLRPGHYVRFVPVTGDEYRRIAEAVARGAYRPEWVVRDEPAVPPAGPARGPAAPGGARTNGGPTGTATRGPEAMTAAPADANGKGRR
ncbi:Allophanate hydrolase subunit 1 [Thermaerobacter marianensis DSM 12885]|uniref:Allophanate hydrolase subunit 1 n=1 Tax=Thermaerobacter marianensis (strain ATCC 700841 / DSM 12885 / JCM 10246 / 7p75a) TaxID=644966 RepID=E6SM87_THEM7|nr:5-oxoprolinase subunit PxpB [Thermaerobacter marianensis]ADU51446.1 Allophanate hydrolase subunit 1 [Thermaerobacter marianensis DSM 12885]